MPETAAAFASKHGCVAMSAEDAVRGGDVVITATSSQEPILKGKWQKEGAQVNVDSREACLNESGGVILSGADIHCEVGEMLTGAARLDPGETTLFESVGLAIEEVSATPLVYEKATA